MLNQMYAFKDNKGHGNGYNIIFNTHSLEKGLSHFELRPFGKQKIKIIISLLKKQLAYENYERLFSFINGINSLRKYKKIYEDNNWTAKQEYKVVSNFLTKYEKIKEQNTGAFILTKEELKQDYDIDYKKFIKSRHSTRNYKNQQLEIEDIKKAIDMAKYSASSCNRQYIKLHYYPKGKMRQNVIDYSIGKGGLYLKGVNTFILTFDANGLSGPGERNQGYFNAGLFATNFVNALHSLGIGTCFIQFGNSVEEEEKLKELNNIPINERITVILFAGYYDEKSIFCISPRKDLEDYITLHE
jgi:nitroreductase